MANGSTTPDVRVTFYDDFVPSLRAAQYTVTVSQTLTVDTVQTAADAGDPTVQSPPQAPFSQTLIVSAPRFVLDPADVHRVFPPGNGTGMYHEFMPMIVLNKRALPWERKMGTDKTPWMALLVFGDDELAQAGDVPPSGVQNPVRTASLPLSKVATIKNVSASGPPPRMRGPKDLALEADEDPDKTFCNVIEIGRDAFAALMPCQADLPFLTHVRVVATDHKEPLNAKHDGWFSVVLANRFAIEPTAGQRKNIAHLVSLEGFEDCLQSDPPALPDGYDKARLVSLYSWAFTCLADPQENFTQLMQNLIAPVGGEPPDLLLRLPVPTVRDDDDGGARAASRLGQGYTALGYAMRSGEQTFAWYRGPLSPVPVPRFLQTPDAGSADNVKAPRNVSEAMIYDPATGLFDQSYAVAFQTGRSLALASLPFATNVLQWRRGAHRLIDLLMEYMRSPHLSGILQSENILDANGDLTQVGIDDLVALLDPNLVSDALKTWLATDFADSIARQIGQIGGFAPQAPGAAARAAAAKAVTPADLGDLMQQPQVVALLQQLSGLDTTAQGATEAAIMPRQIVEWLSGLALLYDVAFNNLVPDARMLPNEAIRFFYVDANWIDALLDGALSVGMQSSRDSLFHRLMRDALHREVDGVLDRVRDKLRGVPTSTQSPRGTMAGFILRSPVVAGWPGLEVRAWSQADGVNPMKPLRLDRLAPDVMIGIYPDVPDRLEFNEPSEGLVFGTEDEGIDLRYLPGTTGESADNIGHMIDKATLRRDQIPRRPPAADNAAIRISGSDGLVSKLQNTFPGTAPVLGPAAFAVQMVRVPEQMLFEPALKGSS
jgi:hypothetical protein